jgi:Mitochondrial carrier protein
MWLFFISAIDTMKVVLQVDGSEGFRSLIRRLRAGKISSLYQGCIATALASMMGHYPWVRIAGRMPEPGSQWDRFSILILTVSICMQFFTYNWLAARKWVLALLPSTLIRNASIGLASSVVSDVVVNAIRVIKTTKQSLGSRHSVTYAEAVRIIVAADGWMGLFGRGLSTRIYCNAIQSIVFTVIWRALADRWHERKQNQESGSTR